jgi:hypothetical protein
MLTKLTIRNFKRFEDVVIELASPVVFVGPNNCGKTTALQALALWDLGLKHWQQRKGARSTARTVREGTALNRLDLIPLPVPDLRLLWHDTRVSQGYKESGRQKTRWIYIDLVMEGTGAAQNWACGMHFYWANEEALYCRPFDPNAQDDASVQIPDSALNTRVVFLHPMSGMAQNEPKWEPGRVNVLIGEGQTAQVLRNLCHQVVGGPDGESKWNMLRDRMEYLFGDRLKKPKLDLGRGEIQMSYTTPGGVELDISASGRGFQQALLLMAFMSANPNSVVLLDEPDAHLEFLRQREIYSELTSAASSLNNQLVIASHSEVLLNEAADRDVVVAFVGRPHRIDDRGSQLLKSLKAIGYDQYLQAEQTGWVLYVEGSTDLAILQALARVMNHEAQRVLERPFVHYVGNQPTKALDHFFGLKEAKNDLCGYALFDRLGSLPSSGRGLQTRMWSKCEIENYLCQRDTILCWTRVEAANREIGPLFADHWIRAMEESIQEIEESLKTLGRPSPWSDDLKVTDDFLDPLFRNFYGRLSLPNEMLKRDYHELAKHVNAQSLHADVRLVLDEICDVARTANPTR